MARLRSTLLVAGVLLAVTFAARAEDAPGRPPKANLEDIVYKGVIGKALDAVPMDRNHRLALQRTNAVISNTFAGRSLSIWVGLTNPILLIGGLVWGLFAAKNIEPEVPPAMTATAPGMTPASLVEAQSPLDPQAGAGRVPAPKVE